MRLLFPFLASLVASAAPVTFDFGNGNTNTNNSQNGGVGNWIPFANETTAVITSASTTIGGITMTLIRATATDGNSTADEFWGINSQGVGVITDNNGGSSGRRLDSAETIAFSFDTDVYLTSARFGSFYRNGGDDESAVLSAGGSAIHTVTETNAVNVDTAVPTNDYSLGNVFVPAHSEITLSTPLTIASGFLFNEITVDPSPPPPPAGDLVVTTIATFPSATVVANPTAAPNPGSTLVAAGNVKGQSFSLAAEASVTGFVFGIGNITTTGTFQLEVARGMDRLPWLPSVVSGSASFPADLPASGGLIQIDLPEALILQRGTWTVTLEGGTADFAMPFSNDPLYPEGALIRKNPSTGDQWVIASEPDSDLVFAVLGTEGSGDPAPSGKPNIVFILADDLGWTDVQCGPTGPNVLAGSNFGSTYYQTPRLATLAAEGLSFTHAFVHPNCAPSRAALLSGQYPSRSGNGVYHVTSLNRGVGTPVYKGPAQNEDIPPGHVITPEALQQAGYVTAHVGKYHLANHETGLVTMPENQGFDCNFGGKETGNPGNYFASGGTWHGNIGPGLAAYAAPYSAAYVAEALQTRATGNDPTTLIGTPKHLSDAVGDAATAFVRDHLAGALADRPFYMQVHFYAVHTPIQPRPDLAAKYSSLPTSPTHDNVNYAALVEGLDQNVGRILDRLEDPDGDGDTSDSIAGDTLVVFLSDNGGHIGATDNDPLRHRKGSFWNGGLRVPMIIRQPGTVPAASHTDTLVHAVDFYPTILAHAGVPLPPGIFFDGESFDAHMKDPAGHPRDRGPVFYHFPGYLDQRARPVEVAIQRIGGEDYKLLYNYDTQYTGNPASAEDIREGLKVLAEPWELYKFGSDISETEDLIEDSHSNQLLYGGIADRMAAGLRDWLTQPGADWEAHPLTVRSTGEPVDYPAAEVPDTAVPFARTLRVTAQNIDSESGEVSLTWNSEGGFHYDVQASDGLGAWQTIATGIHSSGSSTSATVPDPGLSANPDRRFYRIALTE